MLQTILWNRGFLGLFQKFTQLLSLCDSRLQFFAEILLSLHGGRKNPSRVKSFSTLLINRSLQRCHSYGNRGFVGFQVGGLLLGSIGLLLQSQQLLVGQLLCFHRLSNFFFRFCALALKRANSLRCFCFGGVELV